MYDPFAQRNNDEQNSKSYIRGSNKIDFIFCTYNILKAVTQCGMSTFNEITVSYRCQEGYSNEKQHNRRNITILTKNTIQFSQSSKILQNAVGKTDLKR